MLVEYEIQGMPIPKGRPRFNGKTAYTPKRTRDWEALIRTSSSAAMKEKPTEKACSVLLEIYGKFRGDLDNIAKAFLDGMNGVVYKDDRQIKELHIICHDGEKRTLVRVHDLQK